MHALLAHSEFTVFTILVSRKPWNKNYGKIQIHGVSAGYR